MLQWYLLPRRWRYIPSTLVMSTGLFLGLHMWDGLNSTYICPLVVSKPFEARSLPMIQVLALFLDTYLAISTLELCGPTGGVESVDHIPLVVSKILLSAPVVWTAVGTIAYFMQPQYRRWLMCYDFIDSFSFLFRLAVYATLACIFIFSTVYSVSARPPSIVPHLTASPDCICWHSFCDLGSHDDMCYDPCSRFSVVHAEFLLSSCLQYKMLLIPAYLHWMGITLLCQTNTGWR